MILLDISFVKKILTNNTIIVIIFISARYYGRGDMGRVPITIMGYRCERCGHEWVPRGEHTEDPRVCPKCRSPWWNKPKKSMMPYDDFKAKIRDILKTSESPLTWTEIRTKAGLPQLFPNNQWVRKLEEDIGLYRQRDQNGVIMWQLREKTNNVETTQAPKTKRPRAGGKQGTLE
jgi:DNA-directed RNA polymerase subunit RPC12/RpoP